MTVVAGPAGRTRRVPPGPPRTATFRLLRELFTDRLSLLSSAASRYGDAARIAIGPKALYLFNSPEGAKHVLADNSSNYHKGIGLVEAKKVIGDGLLTSEGELWRTQRKLIQPAFQHKRIAAQAGVVAAEAGQLVDRLRNRIGAGPVDMTHEMTGLTLGVLGRTLLDSDLGDLGDLGSIGHAFESVQDQAMFEAVTLSLVPSWLPLPMQRRSRKANAELRDVVNTLVARRAERAGEDVAGADVLSRLIESTRRESDPAVGAKRLRDELVTLLLAGHETTASTLSWALYLVGRHPEVAARLREEAATVLGDRPPEFADLRRLSYTGMVVQEVMRMYPPVWLLPRIALAEDEVAGFHVPAGSDVVVCPYTMHRHPDFWHRPELFDPDRFHPDHTADRPRYAYIPFGGGPRFCVGSNLGTMEAVFTLAMISRELRLRGAAGPAVAEPMLSLRVRGGLPMTVHPAH
ncbi:cytochrome P450 [Amycolatopsis antarctica]|uniref:Cytochrome P450 n=1 Tax=Amycolatopsis antarctica TaxID=1854586 RepID=A0A263D0G5_9PSEU|nr:cytochrome P450 [Amycolatopsis antarctica]OZM71923.1 cytochrome P450 [Amycolatopsis antarctica]